jgi:hypothetical protein
MIWVGETVDYELVNVILHSLAIEVEHELLLIHEGAIGGREGRIAG